MTDLLDERFLEGVKVWGGRTALLVAGRRLTYAELAAEVDLRAAELMRCGVRAGDRVGVSLPNSVAWVATAFATWKLGAVLADVQPGLKAQEVEALFAHADVAVKVTAAGVATVAGSREAAPPGTACINLTSGTTGRPKGVVLTHANLVRNAELIIHELRVMPEDVGCLVLPLYFGMNKIALLAHLFAGAAVLLEPGFMTPNTVLAAMQAAGATSLHGVPATFHALLQRGDVAAYPQPRLRILRIGAGRVMPELMARLQSAFPGVAITLTYGLTEIGLVTLLTSDEFATHAESIGRPVAGVRVAIAEPDAAGVGEVVVAAAHAATAYWRDEVLTREAFQVDGVHTGDLGRLGADGYLYLSGREKDVIKSGGENVPAAVVEAALARHPGVAECAAAGVADAALGEAVVAWVVPKPGVTLVMAELQRHAARELAPIQRPREIRVLAELPRNAVGKVEKRRLGA